MSPTQAPRTGPASPVQPLPPRGDVVQARLFDPDRLHAVMETRLLDTPADVVLDHLADVAARLTGLPLAFLTLVDDRRSYWKAAVGTGISADDTESRQNTLQEFFCQYVIATECGP